MQSPPFTFLFLHQRMFVLSSRCRAFGTSLRTGRPMMADGLPACMGGLLEVERGGDTARFVRQAQEMGL